MGKASIMAAKATANKADRKTPVPELPVRERAVEAALELSAQLGWDFVTLSDIAMRAEVPLADIAEHFDDKTDILVAYGRMVDKRTLAAVGEADPAMSERDRLFDILMERFDILGRDREAVISMLKSLRLDPAQAVIGLPHLGRSMAWMLEAAGIGTGGIKGAIRVAGLCAVYLNAMRHWVEDDSADLAKTMAALDKSLNRAEQAAGTFML